MVGTSWYQYRSSRHMPLPPPQANKTEVEYLGFDPSTSSLLRTRASDCANTPRSERTWPYDPRLFTKPRPPRGHITSATLDRPA